MSCDRSDNSKNQSGIKRREAIIASQVVSHSPPVASIQPAPSGEKTKRVLCEGKPLDRPLPSHKLGHAEARGTAPIGTAIPTGDRFTWVSMWAAWCGPCKEEMPLLLGWQKRLSKDLRVVFLSLDDDERQLMRFLNEQPATGVRATLWLPEGKTRDRWMSDLGLDTSPELPIQLLVDPKGKVRCIVTGAVDAQDFDRVASMVASAKTGTP